MSLADWLRKPALFFGLGSDSAPLPLSETRFIVLDVDVTGVDIRKDKATGIAILPVEGGRCRIADMNWIPLAQPDGSPAPLNSSWREQYRAMVDSAAANPIVTYNTRFVRRMIKCSAVLHDLPLPGGRWVDLAAIMGGAVGSEMGEVTSLKYWQEQMGVAALGGHSAAGDVFAMAQLLEIALAYCEDREIVTLDGLIAEQKARTWLRGE